MCAYDATKPVTGGSLVAADIRENFRALKEDKIVSGTMQMKTGTYEGNGADNRSIDISINLAAATYAFVQIKRDDSTDWAVYRYLHMPGDLTYQYANAAPAANKVQSFTATGFQVGSHNEVNANAHTYDYMVIYQV